MPRLLQTCFSNRRIVVSLAVLLCLMTPMQVMADNLRTLGWLEWAWLQPGGVKIKTKLDTGAKTSSIYAVDIAPFEREGELWVRFRIPLEKRSDDSSRAGDIVLERLVERETRIKDHEDASRRRYVVMLEMCMGGHNFNTPVTLADRGRFNYPLLLGRLALQGRAVVDPARIFTASRSCKSATLH